MAKKFVNGQPISAEDLNKVYEQAEQATQSAEQARLQTDQAKMYVEQFGDTIQQTMQQLSDGQAVAAQVALNTADIELIKTSYEIVGEVDYTK